MGKSKHLGDVRIGSMPVAPVLISGSSIRIQVEERIVLEVVADSLPQDVWCDGGILCHRVRKDLNEIIAGHASCHPSSCRQVGPCGHRTSLPAAADKD